MRRTKQPRPKRFTNKQELFVQEYLIDFNASRAARAAGYSEKTAGVMGHTLLKNPKIQQAIRKAMDERAERTKVTQDKVLTELAKIAFSDMRSFLKWDSYGVTLVSSTELSDADAGCVVEVSQKDSQFGRDIRFKLHDKKSALELLGRHLGMFSESTVKLVGDKASPVEVTHEFSDASIKEAFQTLYKGALKE